MILNNPCNPTGALYTRGDLESLAAVLREPAFQHVLVLSDEIYERIVYDGQEHVCFAALPGMRDRTLMVNGVAKVWWWFLVQTNGGLCFGRDSP